jgi:hypothetical protein
MFGSAPSMAGGTAAPCDIVGSKPAAARSRLLSLCLPRTPPAGHVHGSHRNLRPCSQFLHPPVAAHPVACDGLKSPADNRMLGSALLYNHWTKGRRLVKLLTVVQHSASISVLEGSPEATTCTNASTRRGRLSRVDVRAATLDDTRVLHVPHALAGRELGTVFAGICKER